MFGKIKKEKNKNEPGYLIHEVETHIFRQQRISQFLGLLAA